MLTGARQIGKTVAIGSLLGTELKNIRSVPVGFMMVKDVYPLDLEEFASALGMPDEVKDSLCDSWVNKKIVDPVVHDSIMRVLRLYLVVGGMPAAVQAYIDSNDLNVVEEKQREILRLYRWDISQYDPDDKLYISEIFDLIPSELNAKNKRFILKNLNEIARFSKYENGFLWLKNAGVAIPAYNVSEPVAPLKLNEQRNLFKLFLCDVGLLSCQYASGIQMQLLSGEVNINYGSIYENFVAQEFLAHGLGEEEHSLYFFNSKKQGEIDFIFEQNGTVVPVEVKSGKDYERHNALKNVLENEQYAIRQALILCNGNISLKGKSCYVPVYMTMFIQKRHSFQNQIYRLELW